MPEASPASDSVQSVNTDETNDVKNGQNGAASAPATKTSDASPAPSTGGEKPTSMLEAVKAAAATDKGDAPPALKTGPNPAEGEKPDGKDPKDELSEDPTDEELQQANPHTAKRMKQLLTQRNTARDEMKALEPDALVGKQVTEFVARAGLSADEVNQGFEVMRLVKQDPPGALKVLAPLVDSLRDAVGQGTLPQDLQQAVDEGRITQELASEIAQQRAGTNLAKGQLQRVTQQTEQERQQREHNEHVERVSGAVTKFNATLQRTDPDYKLKEGPLLREVERRILREGFPKSEEAGLELVKAALKDVDAEIARIRPAQVQSIKPITGGGSSPSAKPAPTSMLEALKAGRQ